MPSSAPSVPTSNPTQAPEITFQIYQVIQSRHCISPFSLSLIIQLVRSAGVTAAAWNSNADAEWAFRQAVAKSTESDANDSSEDNDSRRLSVLLSGRRLSGVVSSVLPEEVTINSVVSLNEVTGSSGKILDEVIPSGIGINYNITVDYTRFGFEDADSFFQYIKLKLVTALKTGKFLSNLQAYLEFNDVHMMPTVISGPEDMVSLLNYAYVGRVRGTDPPTSEPTQGRPTNTPTSLGIRIRYFEIVAGVIISAFLYGIYYIISVATGYLRPRSKHDLRAKNIKNLGLVELKTRQNSDYTCPTESFTLGSRSFDNLDYFPSIDEYVDMLESGFEDYDMYPDNATITTADHSDPYLDGNL
jgi:hypothetical protein